MKSPDPLEGVGAILAERYRIERLLGRGGMAAVYAVRDKRTGNAMALKRSWGRDSSKLRRHAHLLEREFYTLAQLAHPRVIDVYDFGVDDNGPYYTMELLTGAGLDEVEVLPWREVAAVMCDIASSLAILHARSLIHRDVSTRNVRYAETGRVKLIDFGAMVSMGVTKDVVGTAPFMAPEVVQFQALDARVDLFSLGAVGYRLLTGRHAYPSRRVADLRDAWRSKPVPPRMLTPETPEALSALILRLIALDRGRRFHAAAEVIEQLRALTRLPSDNLEVTRAYLTAPTLVGRDASSLEIRKRVLALMRNDGGTVVIRGAPGSGRSRMLDICALEAKLLGVNVIRADARDAAGGEWGVIRAISQQLLAQFPKAGFDAARLNRATLERVIDGLRDDEPAATAGELASSPAERALLIRELRDWVFAIAKSHRLLIVVDDVDRIDEASSAVLAAITHRAERRPVLLAVAAVRDIGNLGDGSLRLMCDLGHEVAVTDLEAGQTESLVRSVFGDVEHVQMCASRIHGLSHGNPRAIMDLAQHLVDTQRARYESGSWMLPSSLDESDLPATLSATLNARIALLSEEARELACGLALADEDAPALEDYPALLSQRDHGQVFRALEELVAARILAVNEDRYTFTQRGFLSVLPATLARERRTEIHRHIAEMLAGDSGRVLRRIYHLLEAGLDAAAVDELSAIDLHGLYPSVALLKRALEAAERLAKPASMLHRLRMMLLIQAPLSADFQVVCETYPVVLQQLERDTGLACYRSLEHLPADARLREALTQTQHAYDSTPADQRVHGVVEAVRELARLYGATAALAVNTLDQELLASLPPLTPLFPLSPTLPVMDQIVTTSCYWARGQTLKARALHQRILVRLGEADRAGFDESQHERARLLIEFGIGLVEAVLGIESAEDHAEVLERQPETRVNAWRVRALFQLAIGDVASARKCARRSELLEMQDGLRERYGRATVGGELILYTRLGEVLSVRGLLDRLSFMADRYPGWRPVERLGRACYCQLQGDYEGSLSFLEQAKSGAVGAQHSFYATIACAHIRALRKLGRIEESVQWGEEYIVQCTQAELIWGEVALETAVSWGAAGEYARALTRLEPAMLEAVQLGRVGFSIGAFFEARAQLAIGMRDRDAFEDYAQRCARAYERANNPALGVRLSQLHEEAQSEHLIASAAPYVPAPSLTPQTPASELESIHSRIAECIDTADRARCALTLLLESTGSAAGYLYAVEPDERVQLLAALPEAPSGTGLEHWVRQQAQAFEQPEELETQTESVATVTQATQTASVADEAAGQYIDAEGRTLESALLVAELGGRRVLSGVLVLQTTSARRAIPPQALCSALARELLEYGDVGAVAPHNSPLNLARDSAQPKVAEK